MGKPVGVAAIKAFFEADGGKKIEMADVKALSSEERAELVAMIHENMDDEGRIVGKKGRVS